MRLLKIGLAVVLTFVLMFANLSAQADVGNKVKGTLKQVEGKTEQAIGNLTGDKEAQIKGKVKQAEGQIRSVPGNAKSEDEVIGATQQAESNIRRYQSDEYQTSNPIEAIQH